MDEKVDRYYHENFVTLAERTIRRLWILAILLIVLLVATNAMWIYYENQFEDIASTTTETIECDASGDGVAIANRSGEVIYNAIGEDNQDDNDQEQTAQDGR